MSVEVERPRRARGHAHLRSVAAYYLPVVLGAPAPPGRSRPTSAEPPHVDWFRLRVVEDERTERTSVVLSRGEGSHEEGRELTLSLVDRLPARAALGRERLRRALLEIRDRDRGGVVVSFDEAPCGVDLDPSPGRVDSDGDVDGSAREILGADWVEWDRAEVTRHAES